MSPATRGSAARPRITKLFREETKGEGRLAHRTPLRKQLDRIRAQVKRLETQLSSYRWLSPAYARTEELLCHERKQMEALEFILED